MDKRGKLASLGMIGRLSHLPTVGPLVQVQARLRCYLEFGEAVTERNDPCEIRVCASQCDSLYAYTVSVIVVSLTPYRQDRRSYRKAITQVQSSETFAWALHFLHCPQRKGANRAVPYGRCEWGLLSEPIADCGCHGWP